MQTVLSIFLLEAVACSVGFAQASHPPDLSGTWQLKSDASTRWILAQKQDQIHVQEFEGSSLKTDYTCGQEGKECTFKDSGHAAKTSFWFNGPKLVEMRVHGDTVIKRRFDLTADGNTLEVEVLPISPPGKADKIEFSRTQ